MEWTAISRILLLGLSVYLDRDHMKGKREAEFSVLETVVDDSKTEKEIASVCGSIRVTGISGKSSEEVSGCKIRTGLG